MCMFAEFEQQEKKLYKIIVIIILIYQKSHGQNQM
jgi:hypothetical protein